MDDPYKNVDYKTSLNCHEHWASNIQIYSTYSRDLTSMIYQCYTVPDRHMRNARFRLITLPEPLQKQVKMCDCQKQVHLSSPGHLLEEYLAKPFSSHIT